MCHVLIIEDDAIAALDIQGVLSGAGVHTFSFADTERGAVMAARARHPDFITSDVMLSSGFGHMAVRLIQAELGEIPTVFITATPEQCAGCPPDRVLAKPFCTHRLLELFVESAPPD